MYHSLLRPRAFRPLWVAAWLAVLVLLSGPHVSADETKPAPRGSVSGGYGSSQITEDGWARGLEGHAFLAAWKHSGIHLGGNLYSKRTGSSGDSEGGVLDAGLWLSFGSDTFRPVVFAGLSGSQGNPYEVDLNSFGFHVGYCQEVWFTRNIGVYLRGMLRIWLARTDMTSCCPSVGAGLCFRF